MSKSFVIELNGNLSSILKKTEKEILKNGGRFNGDINYGNFSGKTSIGIIDGKYEPINTNKIKITITDKPLIVSYKKIESVISGYFR